MNSSLPVPQDPLVGRSFSSELLRGVQYHLDRLLGQGGTAKAYFAIRLSAQGRTPVVVKVILPQLVQGGEETGSLVVRKEAVALGRLNERMPPCPYVVRFVDTGTLPPMGTVHVPPLPWLAIEYVHGGAEGTALDDRVAYSLRSTGYGFDPERAGRALEALSRGLGEIHGAGVIHRDLKPGNVLCCGSGETEMFKISDFGIARSVGLAVTFGDVTVGTPGYLAPEQVMVRGSTIGPHTDVFALAGLVYFVLTGEHYFCAETSVEAFREAECTERRSLADARGLCPELRDRPAAISALDAALARATAYNPEARPASARTFAEGIMPWLSDKPHSARVSPRWLGSVQSMSRQGSLSAPTSVVRHPLGGDRVIVSAAFNAAGHCLAVTTKGPQVFDGTAWADLPVDRQLRGYRLWCARRCRPVSWVVGASQARLYEIAREGTSLLAKGPDPAFDFVDVSGDLDDLAVVVAMRSGLPPALVARAGRRWLRPLHLPDMAVVSGLCQLQEEQWLVVGRSTSGAAAAVRYKPLLWELQSVVLPRSRALLACSSRYGRGLAVAVGAEGAILAVDGSVTTPIGLPGSPDLAAVALDSMGTAWVAGLGKIWTRDVDGQIVPVWEEPTWKTPFVSLHAETGHALALSVDGGVLELSLGEVGPTVPA
ncbi:MAG: serine/threonine protein kinase [Polyangiaceae bacterium]|nr:serine/threonine protein kinase [Polyangiaceae bacterium]